MTAAPGSWWGSREGGHTLADLAEHAGWKVRSGFARGPCLRCDSETGGWGCITRDRRARVGCHACEDWKGIRRALDLDGDGRQPGPTFRAEASRKHGPHALDLVEDADVLGRIYAVMDGHLRMADAQAERVLGRDRAIPPQIRERMTPLWRSLGPMGGAGDRVAQAIAADLTASFDREILRRVPELVARGKTGFSVLPMHRRATYLEPWKDEQGRIGAVRGYQRGGAPKYRATKGRTGPVLHVAYGVPREQVADVPWLLTEGWMKAEVAAHTLGVVAIAFPGVTAKQSWKRALQIKQRLAPDAPTYIAYDAEIWTTRPDIASVAFDLAREVRWTEGRCSGFAAWDADISEERADPKGIDDAIVAGRQIHLVDRLGFGAYLGPAMERWDRRVAA